MKFTEEELENAKKRVLPDGEAYYEHGKLILKNRDLPNGFYVVDLETGEIAQKLRLIYVKRGKITYCSKLLGNHELCISGWKKGRFRLSPAPGWGRGEETWGFEVVKSPRILDFLWLDKEPFIYENIALCSKLLDEGLILELGITTEIASFKDIEQGKTESLGKLYTKQAQENF